MRRLGNFGCLRSKKGGDGFGRRWCAEFLGIWRWRLGFRGQGAGEILVGCEEEGGGWVILRCWKWSCEGGF